MEHLKLKPEIKSKWIEALRSGEYKQGRGALRSADDDYCCIGVLCEVLKFPKKLTSSEMYAYSDDNDDRIGAMGRSSWFNLFLNEGDPEKNIHSAHNIQSDLITLNDCKKLSFNEIADWIEENL